MASKPFYLSCFHLARIRMISIYFKLHEWLSQESQINDLISYTSKTSRFYQK